MGLYVPSMSTPEEIICSSSMRVKRTEQALAEKQLRNCRWMQASVNMFQRMQHAIYLKTRQTVTAVHQHPN